MSRKARERVIYRRFVRKFVRTITRVESRVPSKSLGRPGDSGAAASVQIRRAARPAMSSFSGRLSHPKPEGRQRSQIGRARSATARFFGRVTVPSAVTSAAPGAWRILVPARSHGDGGIVSQRANGRMPDLHGFG